jgi:hypothetical protein
MDNGRTVKNPDAYPEVIDSPDASHPHLINIAE